MKAKDGSTPVGIFVHSHGSELEFQIVDRAGGFDVSSVEQPDELEEGGIGLQIIRSLFPKSVVESNPDGGTTVRFAVPNVPRTEAGAAP